MVAGVVFGGISMKLLDHWSPKVSGASDATPWERLVDLLVTLTSGTWAWAVLVVVGTAVLTRSAGADRPGEVGPPGQRVDRWLWGWAVATVMLSAISITWYGVADLSGGGDGDDWLTRVALLVPLCAVIAAALAVVGVFWRDRDWFGLAARLALPAGLALVLVAAPPPSLAYGGMAAIDRAVWWTQHALGALWAGGVLVHALVERHGRTDQAVVSVGSA